MLSISLPWLASSIFTVNWYNLGLPNGVSIPSVLRFIRPKPEAAVGCDVPLYQSGIATPVAACEVSSVKFTVIVTVALPLPEVARRKTWLAIT